MHLPSRADFMTLYRHGSGPCVSLYMPTHRSGSEITQGPIRLKNLLRQAAGQLDADGDDDSVSKSILAQGWQMVEDHEVWRYQTGGLALFFAPDTFHAFQVAAELPEQVVVGVHFHLSPLLPFYPVGEKYHVLALSQEKVRLLVGDRFRLREIEADEIPQDLRDIVGYDHEQKSLQFRTGIGGGAGGQAGRAIYHGHGAGDDDADKELQQFMLRVDDAVLQLVDHPHPPMVLAAVERVAAEYRDVSKHDRVVEEVATGNPDHLSATELHDKTWPLVRGIFVAPADEAVELYGSLSQTERVSDALGDIVDASDAGRVDTLLVVEGERRWGRFDAETRQIELDESATDGAIDLVGRAAMDSLINGGKVFVLDGDKLPGDGPVAAIYRY